MTLIQALILALAQGLTEFLPVSSSGHLVIIQNLFGFTNPPIFFDIMLHAGTLLAVMIFFRNDLISLVINWQKNIKFIIGLIIASIPAGIVGILLSSRLESIFSSTRLVGVTLLITGSILLLTRWFKTNKTNDIPTIRQSLFIGLFQAVAVLPGVSRSGSTISAGLYSGVSPSSAFRYSFFLAIPAILGALLMQFKDTPLNSVDWGTIVLGFIVAALVGFISLNNLGRIIQKGKLYYFSFYCFTLGLICLLFLG